MQPLARHPAAAYRRVELDARIEASGGADLTRICLEEAVMALGQAVQVMARSSTGHRHLLARSQAILVWLAQSVSTDHPLQSSLKQFYGGLASQIGANIQRPDPRMIARIQNDIRDLLETAG